MKLYSRYGERWNGSLVSLKSSEKWSEPSSTVTNGQGSVGSIEMGSYPERVRTYALRLVHLWTKEYIARECQRAVHSSLARTEERIRCREEGINGHVSLEPVGEGK